MLCLMLWPVLSQAADLNGQWKLVYTSSSELTALLALSRLPFVTVGDITQTIDVPSETVVNKVRIPACKNHILIRACCAEPDPPSRASNVRQRACNGCLVYSRSTSILARADGTCYSPAGAADSTLQPHGLQQQGQLRSPEPQAAQRAHPIAWLPPGRTHVLLVSGSAIRSADAHRQFAMNPDMNVQRLNIRPAVQCCFLVYCRAYNVLALSSAVIRCQSGIRFQMPMLSQRFSALHAFGADIASVCRRSSSSRARSRRRSCCRTWRSLSPSRCWARPST